MNFFTHFVAIAHHSHIAGDDGRDARLLGSINDFLHRRDVVVVNHCVDGEVSLDAMLVAGGSNLTQVVDSKMIGRM